MTITILITRSVKVISHSNICRDDPDQPLSVKAIYSQVECALYAKVHNRLETYVLRDLLSDFSE